MTRRIISIALPVAVALAAWVAIACEDSDDPETPAMTITSTAFENGQPIPTKYTGEGDDVSPPLAWSGLPDGAQQLALICDDPDAPTDQPWVHWVIYGLPPTTTALPEGVPPTETVEDPPATQGVNGWPGDVIGYKGPMPPPGHGVHHYHFKLYALDAALELEAGLTKAELLEAMDGHVLATGELIGTYERR
ncbi:MAG: YbhB/YbcL family Raf kinase inhibitor-like protein [Planctomycetota bacterium]|jgi:Raf kinase inhibitor-like YbhB/YbcL family protein